MKTIFVAVAFALAGFAAAAEEAVEGNALVCLACKQIFNNVYEKVTSNSTEGEIEQELDGVCNILGGILKPIRPICTGYINEHIDELINDIKHDDTPDQICTRIHACGNATVAREEPVGGGLFCPLCESAIGKVYADWDNDTSHIESEIDKICDIVPKDIRLVCDFEVNREYNKIKNGLENHDSPQAVCTDIGLCTSDQAPPATPRVRGAVRHYVREQLARIMGH